MRPDVACLADAFAVKGLYIVEAGGQSGASFAIAKFYEGFPFFRLTCGVNAIARCLALEHRDSKPADIILTYFQSRECAAGRSVTADVG